MKKLLRPIYSVALLDEDNNQVLWLRINGAPIYGIKGDSLNFSITIPGKKEEVVLVTQKK